MKAQALSKMASLSQVVLRKGRDLRAQEHHLYDEELQKLQENLKERNRCDKSFSTNYEFADHLLDVHRNWCFGCRPHPAEKEPIHQATQTDSQVSKLLVISRVRYKFVLFSIKDTAFLVIIVSYI